MNCKYFYANNDSEKYTYDQIIRILMGENGSTTYMLFSAKSEQDLAIDTFETIRNNSAPYIPDRLEFRQDCENENLFTSGSPDKMHVLQFLNSPMFVDENSNPYVLRLSDKELKQELKDRLRQAHPSLSDAQLDIQVDAEFDNYKLQGMDGYLIHLLMNMQSERLADDGVFNGELDRIKAKYHDNKEFCDRIDELRADANFKNNIRALNGSIVSTRPLGSKVLFQVPVAGKINVNGKEFTVYDVIDQVVVQDDGTIHIYKVKVSEQPKGSWDSIKANTSPKVERYRYQLNMIKALLEDNGIRGNKVQLHILGAVTDYEVDSSGKLQLKQVGTEAENVQMDISNSTVQTSKHYNVVAQMVNPKCITTVSPKVVTAANNNIALMFPESNISLDMLWDSADTWIKNNSYRIHKVAGSTYAYEVYYPGEKGSFKIKESTPIENNAELHEVVTKLINKTNQDNQFVLSSLKSIISQAFKSGRLNFSTRAFKNCEELIRMTILPYLNDSVKDTRTGELKCNWEFINQPELLDLGIIMLKHKSGRIDVISLTNLDLNVVHKFNNASNRTTLAGGYYYDIDSRGIDTANGGTIRTVCTLMLLNELMSQMPKATLGNVTILSTIHTGQSRTYNIQNFVSRNLSPLIQVVRDNNAGVNISNNLAGANSVDLVDSVIQQFQDLLNSPTYQAIPKVKESLDEIKNATNDSVKVKALLELAQNFMMQLGLQHESLENWVANLTVRPDITPAKRYLIGKAIADAIAQLTKREVSEPKKITSLEELSMPVDSINSNNFKVVVRLFRDYSNQINQEAYDEGLTINKIVKEYLQARGYGTAYNRIVGNETNQFTHLFETDNNGKIHESMQLKNPWDNSVALLSHERKFIKQAVFLFTKYRYQNKGMEFKFSSYDSKEFEDFAKANLSWILAVPLMKASSSSKVQTGYAFKDTATRIRAFIEDPVLYSHNILESKAIEEEIKGRNLVNDVWRVSPHNYFDYGEPEITLNGVDTFQREKVLKRYDDMRYFETNLEDVLRDFSMETVRAQNMRRFMVASKLFCLKMYFTKNQSDNVENIQSELDAIQKYIKVNVFGQPLIESSSIVLAHNIIKLRNLVSKLFIMGNVAGGMRDTFEGFQQMMVRAITKEEPTINTSDVLRAYGIVVEDMMINPDTASLISQLCIKYRMSNIDVSNVAEGMKTGKSGIFHFENEMYKTLRTPDFLNRMVYFVAKAIHEGIWGAISLDKDGLIKYDWKKDKRFNLLATNNQNNKEEYLKQKALFIAYVKLWNDEHPKHIIENFEDLPMPYSEQEVEQIHKEADRIWGSYDRGAKALGEHMMFGLALGMFTTWMNAGIDRYFKKAQSSTTDFEWVQMKDDATGELLWIDKDGKITTEDTGMPCYVRQPIIVQGIIGTLMQMWTVLNTDNQTLKTHVFNNKENVKNMVKLRNDIVVSIIYLALVKVALQAWREKQKEVTDPHDLITNALCEILYRGMYNSWDGFKGPINVITFIGEDINPPFYTESLALAKDLFRTTFGDMTILSFGSRHFAPIRSIRETIKAYETGKQPS